MDTDPSLVDRRLAYMSLDVVKFIMGLGSNMLIDRHRLCGESIGWCFLQARFDRDRGRCRMRSARLFSFLHLWRR